MAVMWHKYTAKCLFIVRLNIEHDIISLSHLHAHSESDEKPDMNR